MSSELTVVLEDVEYTTHLREDEHSGSLGLHRLEELVENDHFTGILDQVLIRREGRSRFLHN